MVDLAKFTTTSKADFEQLARDRKEDFEALRREQRWTASVYLGPYIVEARLKAKICEQLNHINWPIRHIKLIQIICRCCFFIHQMEL